MALLRSWGQEPQILLGEGPSSEVTRTKHQRRAAGGGTNPARCLLPDRTGTAGLRLALLPGPRQLCPPGLREEDARADPVSSATCRQIIPDRCWSL